MLTLDQVRLLENRVEKAVGRIQSLTSENTHLHTQLTTLQARVNELEGLVRVFKDDQGRIEEGILNALDRLSAFEDSVYTDTSSSFEESESEETEFTNNENNTEKQKEDDEEIESIEIESTESESISGSDGQMDIF